jgi:hypothetical protein
VGEQMPSAENDAGCAHQFLKDGWQRWETWLPRRKWRCGLCGFETRAYDGADRMALRPIHPHMSVAFVGFNTRVIPPASDQGPSDG